MKEMTLQFPNTLMLVHFVINYEPQHSLINSAQLRLTAYLTEDDIAIACTLYDAFLVPESTWHLIHEN